MGLFSLLLLPFKNDVSTQCFLLSAAVGPRISILCLAVKNLRLALVLDLEWTDFQLGLMSYFFIFITYL